MLLYAVFDKFIPLLNRRFFKQLCPPFLQIDGSLKPLLVSLSSIGFCAAIGQDVAFPFHRHACFYPPSFSFTTGGLLCLPGFTRSYPSPAAASAPYGAAGRQERICRRKIYSLQTNKTTRKRVVCPVPRGVSTC